MTSECVLFAELELAVLHLEDSAGAFPDVVFTTDSAVAAAAARAAQKERAAAARARTAKAFGGQDSKAASATSEIGLGGTSGPGLSTGLHVCALAATDMHVQVGAPPYNSAAAAAAIAL